MTKSQSSLGAAFERHFEKKQAEAEKLREATRDDPGRPRPTSFVEAGGRMIEQAWRVADYKKEHRND